MQVQRRLNGLDPGGLDDEPATGVIKHGRLIATPECAIGIGPPILLSVRSSFLPCENHRQSTDEQTECEHTEQSGYKQFGRELVC